MSVMFPIVASADTYQSFHASKDGFVTIWKTKNDVKVSVVFNKSVKECFTYKWKDFAETDREIIFEPSASVNSIQKEAFFSNGTMNNWDDFWDGLTPPYYYEWPVLADNSDQIDIYVGVDLSEWTDSPALFSLGDVIPIIDGRNDTLLPGYLVSDSPIGYVSGTGWVASSPLTTNVVVTASRNGEPIPEPATICLFGLGSLALFRQRR